MAKTDEQLMELCQKGSRAAFKKLLVRYQDKLRAFIYSQVRDFHLAEDIAQESFIRVYRRADRFLPDHSFKTWLYTIALNLCRDEQRKAKLHKIVPFAASPEQTEEGGGPGIESLQDQGPGPRELAGVRELEEILNAEMGKLSAEQKEVVIMNRLLGLRYEEISRILGIPLGTVRSRLHYALEQLRRKVEKLTRE